MEVLPITEHQIDAFAVLTLYREANWWPERTLTEVRSLLHETSLAVGAWDGERLVGFARAVSDDRFRAYVEDVVVAIARRREGIALRLVAALLDLVSDVDNVSLFCESALVPFYEQAGFRATSQVVMHRRMP